jgi:prophage DNA circulation protein
MMAADRDTILSWLADLSAAIVIDSEDAADLTARIAVAPDLDAEAFANEALLMMRVIAESVDSPDDFDRLAQTVSATGATLDAISIMSGMALAVAGCRPAWPSRPAARRTRSRVAIAGDLAIDAVAQLGADGADLFAWLTSITAISCRIISDLAADAAPIVKASTGVSLPSTVLAYQLYGDANRAGGLVDISGSATPLVMPTLFDALAS